MSTDIKRIKKQNKYNRLINQNNLTVYFSEDKYKIQKIKRIKENTKDIITIKNEVSKSLDPLLHLKSLFLKLY